MTATLESQPDGTVIYCRFGMHPFVIGFMIFWICFVLSIGGLGAIESMHDLNSRNPPADAWIGVFLPPGMILFAVLLMSIGWLVSSGDQEFLMNFVRRTVNAQAGYVWRT